MPDFFRPDRELTIEEIAELTHSTLREGSPSGRRIRNIAPLDTAGPSDVSFLDNSKFVGEFAVTRAGACVVAPRFAKSAPSGLALLVNVEPYRAFVSIARALFPTALHPSSLFGANKSAAGAHIHPTARIEAGVTIDPYVMIGPRAEIGASTLIAAGAVIGPDVSIGRACAIGAGASIMHAMIGDRVIIHPGARIGQDGFGYLPDPKGHVKIPQTRHVIIQDNVEIGANTSIDRGSTRDTIVGEGTKIDNLVQIAHNVVIGRHCLIAGQVGISGSAKVGDFVMMGGKVGIADHVTIGDGAILGAQSGVMSDIPAGGRYVGSPAQPIRDFMKGVAALRRLARGRGKNEGEDA